MEPQGERPEYRSEEAVNRKFKSTSGDEFPRNLMRDDDREDTHYMVTGDNESPNHFPEFLTDHIPPRTVRNQSNCDHNDSLYATLPAPEQDPPMAHKTQFRV